MFRDNTWFHCHLKIALINLKDLIKRFPDKHLNLLKTLENVEDEFSVYRKNSFKNRQVWLNKEAKGQLHEGYQQLRKRYVEAKKVYQTEYDAFFRIKRNATTDDWKAHWNSVFSEKFSDLMPNPDFDSLEPSKLAYAQAAKTYDYTPEYIPKIIREQKQIALDQQKREHLKK